MENQVSSILILREKASSLKLAEQFLRHRGWEIYFANNLKSLIFNLAQRQPKYLMIPADFPHKKIRLLPNVLAQAFDVKIILYAEQTTSIATAKLQEINHEYRLYPPVSGPAIERMIFKIQRDEVLRQEQDQGQRQNPSGEVKSVAEFEIRIKQDQENARGALTALLKEDDQELSAASGDANYIEGSGGGSRDSSSQGSVAIQNLGSGILGDSLVPGEYQSTESGHFNLSKSGKDLGSGDGDGSIPFYGNRNLNFSATLKKKAGKNSHQEPLSESEDFSLNQVKEALKSSTVVDQKRPEQVNDLSEDMSLTGFKNTGIKSPSAEPVYRFKSKEKVNNETIMVKGTQRALEESTFVRGGINQISEIKTTKNSVCIIVESPKFSGYLVAAMGSPQKIDANFIDLVRERLFAFLKAHGELIQDNERAMEIKLEEVEFNDWALDQAEFLKRAVHDDTEIAMAFFPSQDTSTKLEQSVSEKMLQMDISDLREDVALDFDLYVYLPENKKYLLYTPEGRPLYGNQKNRLAEKGVSKMHLRKDSAHGVKRYRAQLFLNDKIAEFKKKKNKDKVSQNSL